MRHTFIVIGLLSCPRRRQKWSFVHLDPSTQVARWEIDLPWGVQDVMPAGDRAVVYPDLANAVVVKRSRNRTQTLWKLRGGPNGLFIGTRLMSFQ